jgi:hypothetical protein
MGRFGAFGRGMSQISNNDGTTFARRQAKPKTPQFAVDNIRT